MTSKLMFDILERPIKEGDLVVVKGNGSSYGPAKAMEVGIRIGNSIKTMTGSRNPTDKFLIVNPTEKELKIKDDILGMISAKKASKKIKEKIRANIPGHIYLTSRYKEILVYLGNVSVTHYIDGIKHVTQKGHIYLKIDSWSKDFSKFSSLTLEDVIDISKNRSSLSVWDELKLGYDVIVLKSAKSCEKDIGKVADFNPNFAIEYDCKYKVNGSYRYNKGLYQFKK